jgi:uncharacterized membrane protein
MDVQNFAWSVFACVIIILLIFDLGVLNKKDEIITFKKSAYLSLFYIAISCLFGLFLGNLAQRAQVNTIQDFFSRKPCHLTIFS